VAGLPVGVALDYGETGGEWSRGVPSASRGTAGFCVGTPSGTAGSSSPSVGAAGQGEGSAVAGADVVSYGVVSTSMLAQRFEFEYLDVGRGVKSFRPSKFKV
jgi:hypothetical protein